MSVLLRSAQSLEYVLATVSVTNENGGAVDPTGDVVAVAFVPEGDPLTGSTTFLAAAWETNNADPASPIYSAKILVGPTPGVYVPVAGARVDMYVRITDNPEVPKIRAGSIHFT